MPTNYSCKGFPGLLTLVIIVFLSLVPTPNTPLKAQTLQVNPGTIYFGDMSIYQEGITRELRFTNTGDDVFQIESLGIVGRDSAQFSVVSGTLNKPVPSRLQRGFLNSRNPYPVSFALS